MTASAAGGTVVRVTRRPAIAPLNGFRTNSVDGLLTALTASSVVDPAIADLSIGTWRSHEVARSCFAQLGLPWPLPDPPLGDQRKLRAAWMDAEAPGDREPHEAGSSIGDWIDAEGRGDAATLSAVTLAEALFGGLGDRPLALVVIAPRFGSRWRTEDAAFLRFLAQGARLSDSLLLATDDAEPPAVLPGLEISWRDVPRAGVRPRPGGLAPLVPGAVDVETAQALDVVGHPLPEGWTLVPPEWRTPRDPAARLDYDRLGTSSAISPGLRAFAQLHGNNHFVDPWLLCAEANRRLAEGGHDLALELLERAVACARSLADRAALQSLLQGFRIALMRFGEAVAAPDPSPGVYAPLRGVLLMTKGWGLVMSGESARAEPYMHEARELLLPRFSGRLEYLYLLNISALGRVNLGDLEGALRLEREIEAALAARDERDGRLAYVNSINIARLLRRRGDLTAAATYYERAFDTTLGTRTESDLVYTNVCVARLNEDRNRPFDAYSAWLRAALHWLAADVPEAIGWRVLSAILGRKATPADTPVELVASTLAARLGDAAASAGVIPSITTDVPVPTWVRPDRLRREHTGVRLEEAVAIGTTAFSVIASSGAARGALQGCARDALGRLACGLIAASAPIGDCATLVVDDGRGSEMARSRAEFLAACMRLGVRQARFNGSIDELTSVRRRELEARSRISLGRAVAGIERSRGVSVVRFRRYLPPAVLSTTETALLDACDSLASFKSLSEALGRPHEEVVALARGLELRRVVDIGLEVEQEAQRTRGRDRAEERAHPGAWSTRSSR